MPQVIPAAIGAGGSLLGGLFNRPSSEEKAALRAQTDVLTQARDLSTQATNRSADLFSGGSAAMGPALAYYLKLLSGDPTEAMRVLGPDIQKADEAYNQAIKTAATLTPRGGGSSDIFATLPFQRASATGNLFSSARASAAPALLQAGGGQEALGAGVLDSAARALQPANAASSNLLNYGLQNREFVNKVGASTGQGLYDIAKKVNWKGLFGGGGGAGSGSSNLGWD